MRNLFLFSLNNETARVGLDLDVMLSIESIIQFGRLESSDFAEEDTIHYVLEKRNRIIRTLVVDFPALQAVLKGKPRPQPY